MDEMEIRHAWKWQIGEAQKVDLERRFLCQPLHLWRAFNTIGE